MDKEDSLLYEFLLQYALHEDLVKKKNISNCTIHNLCVILCKNYRFHPGDRDLLLIGYGWFSARCGDTKFPFISGNALVALLQLHLMKAYEEVAERNHWKE